MLHDGPVFEVTQVQIGLLGRSVELTALEDMSGIETLVSYGHEMSAYKVSYSFPKGTALTLRFPPWKKFARGARVPLATVLKHPSMQRQLFRSGRS
jgi:hypothetical protein